MRRLERRRTIGHDYLQQKKHQAFANIKQIIASITKSSSLDRFPTFIWTSLVWTCENSTRDAFEYISLHTTKAETLVVKKASQVEVAYTTTLTLEEQRELDLFLYEVQCHSRSTHHVLKQLSAETVLPVMNPNTSNYWICVQYGSK